MWWVIPVEFFGEIALKYGIKYLESQYPGVKPILHKILDWLGSEGASKTNVMPLIKLNEHFDLLRNKEAL